MSGTSAQIIQSQQIGLFSQTETGRTVTGAGVPGSLIASGVGQLSVPADAFSVGDSFLVNMQGTISSQNSDIITLKTLAGDPLSPITLATTGALTLRQSTSLEFVLKIHFTVRTVGATGSIMTSFDFKYLTDSSDNLETKMVLNENIAFDTTIDNTLDITAEFSQATGSIFSELFNLYQIY